MRSEGSVVGRPPLIGLLGPTAVGKTALGISLAQHLSAEIVSVDSKQIYRHMDIGTAKPTPQERSAVPHHVVDCVEPDQSSSAADFQALADKAIRDITDRKKQVLVVGGSGLYFRALVDGLFELPQSDPDLRRRLRKELDLNGHEWMHRRLGEVDPEAASRIHVNDGLRIVRALEVHTLTGIPISDHQKQWKLSPPRYPFHAFVLHRPRQELYARINHRVDTMLDAGWLQEVRQLREMGYPKHLVSMDGLGYRELHNHLDGDMDLPTAVELIKRQTRRFAKRQLTWFRGDTRLEWVDATSCNVSSLTDKIAEIAESTDEP